LAGSQDIVEYLVAHGAYVEAARLCAENGELRRAIELYERVWRFADAIPLALALGDRPLAVRLCLDAGDPGRAAQLAGEIPAEARAELLAASEALAGRGRPFEAGRVAERALDYARAAVLYRRANAALDAGRALELTGELHEAGLLYERLAAQGGEREAAAARLALGRLLGRLGRHREAARMLQRAVRHPSARGEGQRALILELLALGLRRAATEVLARLRREAPELPVSPEAFAAVQITAAPAGGKSAVDVGLLRRRFRIVKLLGAGATGRVYLADDTLLGQTVAVKLLAVGTGATGPERQAYFRFAREAEAAGRLRHPNIVTLHDMDESLGLFVFELMAGGTLADHLAAAGPLSGAAARRLALELLAALGTAHERGIIHRDIKPANIFFDAAGNAKLGDFGAAHLGDFGQTQTGGLVGTVAYMAPEQISGASIGAAADLYALGVTLFEALTGRPPFLGPDIVAQHLGEEPPRPSHLRDDLSPLHDEVLARALNKPPSERYASAEEMAALIRQWPTEATTRPAEPDKAEGAPATAQPSGGAPSSRAPDPLNRGEDGRGKTRGRAESAPGNHETELGRTERGILLLTRDARVGRPVLVERRETPVEGAELTRVQALAAAGGPTVQRILALSDDRRSVIYEAVDGPVVTLEALAPDDQAALAATLAALPSIALPSIDQRPAPASPRIALTAGGPVILIAPDYQPAAARPADSAT
jgi:serine/threonine protein kinase